MDEEVIMTVSELRRRLICLEKNGCGDYRIKIGDSYLYDDEIAYDHCSNEIQIHGYMFHEDVIKKAQSFKDSVDKAYRKLWGI